MAIRYTFQPVKNEQAPKLTVEQPVKKISNLNMFNQLEKQKLAHNEQEYNRRKKIEDILKELDALIGLDSVKQLVLEIQAFVEIQKKRAKEKLITEPVVLHMVFSGNPGCGKTTVARIIGRLFKEIGVLEKGHLVEVERADLVGEYIGHTAHKTREQIKRALGGILFIDEAYSLARGGERDFGKEAIDTMVKNMEEYKDNLILILAGYKKEMDWFIEANPGLRSRFPTHIQFPDYTNQELFQIAELMLAKRQYKLSDDAKIELDKIIASKTTNSHIHSGNARMVRNLIEKAIRQQALRLVDKGQVTRSELIEITAFDLQNVLKDGVK